MTKNNSLPLKLHNLKQKKVVNCALRALLYEVQVFPKPGLVDPLSNNSHLDMNIFMFIDSALSLEDYFNQCYQAGLTFKQSHLPLLLKKIRPLGIMAEKTMKVATHGVNTHKGLIFSLGILVSASGYIYQQVLSVSLPEATNSKANNLGKLRLELNSLSFVIKQMATQLPQTDFNQLKKGTPNLNSTAGEQQFLKYGLTGVRGEVSRGLPLVFNEGINSLVTSEGNLNQRFLDTLFVLARHTKDSNLVKRANSITILTIVQKKILIYQKLGGSRKKLGQLYLKYLNHYFTKHNLSLGGSADLLVLTIYVGLISEVI